MGSSDSSIAPRIPANAWFFLPPAREIVIHKLIHTIFLLCFSLNYPLYSQISQEISEFKWVRSESHFQGEQVDPRSAQADSTIETLAGRVYALAGISERAYGSYRGGSAIQTVSLRCMSPEHTLVLIDGQQYNDFQTGLANFGLLSTTNLERVEVTKGGYSALYGADGKGGIVNIITKKATEKSSEKTLTSLGFFGYYAHEIEISGTGAGIGLVGSVRREGGAGRYQFWFNDGCTTTMLRREGD